MNTKINKEDLKWPQIEAVMRYVYDNPSKYDFRLDGPLDIIEFGTAGGSSLRRICSFLNSNGWRGLSCVFGIDSFEGLPPEAAGIDRFSKFAEGMYKVPQPDIAVLREECDYDKLYLINKRFADLTAKDAEGICKAMIVHVDCDLYLSCKQALTWLLENRLVCKYSLLAFDEFTSTEDPWAGGESRAFYEIMGQKNVDVEEIWHYIYEDKDLQVPVRQSVWEILSV